MIKKKKIKKSDDIIVVAKTPICEIIKETSEAKNIKIALRRLIKKETLDSKIKKIKKTDVCEHIKETSEAEEIKKAVKNLIKKQSPDSKFNKIRAGELYAQANRLIANVYGSRDEVIPLLDYEKLFSYLEKTKDDNHEDYEVSAFERDKLADRELMNDTELTNYLNKAMLNAVVGGNLNSMTIEEKEKMKYYAMFNKSMILMKISLNDYNLTDNFDLDKSV